MPSAFIYLGVLLAVICVWFILFKRPVYEAVLLSFVIIVAITSSWTNIFNYIDDAFSTSLIYSMIVFVAMSQLLEKTKIIDSCIGIVLSIFGRITGGAGYVSVIASSFMGALSGSGPGNVMATGTITIPAMKKSGFPAELAANVESNSSYLGNMIPPSSNIVAALGAFVAVYPDNELTTGQFQPELWPLGTSHESRCARLQGSVAHCRGDRNGNRLGAGLLRGSDVEWRHYREAELQLHRAGSLGGRL